MGTLDPMAEGVLVLGVGKSARLFDYLSGHGKRYVAKLTFGSETDTLDALGTVTATTNDIPSVDAALHAMQSLVGKIKQIPPEYSAKHVNGTRAYKMARAGEKVTLPAVDVEIFGAELICQPKMNEMVFSVDCSAGTYIRSICRDVGRLCGSLATLTYLQRTRTGMFDVKDSISLDALEIVKGNALMPPDAALDMPRLDVEEALYDDLRHGRHIDFVGLGEYKVYCRGEFFGIGHADRGALKLKTYLRDD